MNIKSNTILAKHFKPIVKSVLKNEYTHYWLSGGRGSTKSSCASIAIITGIVNDAKKGDITNAVILRNWSKYLKDSVYNQLSWAIDMLGLNTCFEYKLGPLKIIFKPTGQEILFKGADNPKKIKSIKFKKGYCKYCCVTCGSLASREQMAETCISKYGYKNVFRHYEGIVPHISGSGCVKNIE